MKLRSKGLGRKELVMDFREYEISRTGDEVVVSGTIREPVTWDFAIRIHPDDIPGMLRVGLSRHMVRLGLRWVLHRTSRPPEAAPAGPENAERTDEDETAPRPVRHRVRRSVEPVPTTSLVGVLGTDGTGAMRRVRAQDGSG